MTTTTFRYPSGHQPGDHVVITRTGATGVVTYPGRTGLPGRVYVIHTTTDGRPLTIHHSPTELEAAA